MSKKDAKKSKKDNQEALAKVKGGRTYESTYYKNK